MKKNIVIYCYLLLIALQGAAQPLSPVARQKISGMKKLESIMQVVEDFYREEATKNTSINKGNGDERESFEQGIFRWKRWEHFNKTRLTPDGELEDVAAKTVAAWHIVNSKYGTTAQRSVNGVQNSSNAAWSFIGPFNNSYQNGFFRGLARTDRIVFHPTNPNIFFVCANNGGLWRTENNGVSWVNLTRYFPIQSISGVAVDPNNPQRIFVLTGDGKGGGLIRQNSCGIWFTTNGGSTWTQTSFNRNSQSSVLNGYKLVMAPNNPNTLLAATEGGLFRSTDAGNNWTLVFQGAAVFPDGSRPVFDIEFDPSNASNVYVSSWGRFYKSTNGGATFPASGQTNIAGANRIEIGVSAANSNYVYLLCAPFTGISSFAGVYRSTNNGDQNSFGTARATTPNILSAASSGLTTTSDGDQSNYDLAIAVNPGNGEMVAVGGKIVWRSNDGCSTFTNLTTFSEPNTDPVAPSYYIHPDIHDLAYNPLNNRLYCCNDGGVYVSSDNGTSWVNITNGIHSTTFYHMSAASYDVNKIMGGTQDNGMKYKKNTGDFLHVKGGDGFDCAFGNSASSPIYATNNSIIVKYDNNGDELSVTTPANTNNLFPVITVNPVNDDIVYFASSSTGVFKSTNGGSSWSQVLALAIQQSICNCPSNSNRIYVAGVNGIFRTDNGGSNWSANLASNSGFAGSGRIADVNVCPTNSNLVYAVIGGYTAGTKVLTSNDAGATWINISGTLPAEVNVNCVTIDNNNNAYIGTDMGVYYKAVAEADWTPFFNELPRCPVTDLAIHQATGKIRASTYGAGIWETNVYAACDFGYEITGDNNGIVYGNRFYQASDNISSYATITGTDSTVVTARAGREIILGNNFTVTETQRFNGLLGPCQSGLPSGRPIVGVPVFAAAADKGNNLARYPFGTITVQDGSNQCTVNIPKAGMYKLVLADAGGSETLWEKNIAANSKSSSTVAIDTKKIKPGQYFVQLMVDDKLVHYQELFVKE